MRIEHLQQLDVGGDDADEIALVLALQLGRAELAQSGKDLVPDQCQQLEGDKVVAGLLCITKQAPYQSKQDS